MNSYSQLQLHVWVNNTFFYKQHYWPRNPGPGAAVHEQTDNVERASAFTVARQIISNELEQAMECSLKRREALSDALARLACVPTAIAQADQFTFPDPYFNYDIMSNITI
ncbi:hypothetical protein EV681_1240 [Advenella incenata]|jgi:hypothetical protein|uniref:Uncharacterized protein n=1 Tax=Advenella incenata TaxID=267800 RepID=A0A4Q7VSW5_9BURK|nr:hypothetical protein EV681_1240 [Advenella incenata]